MKKIKSQFKEAMSGKSHFRFMGDDEIGDFWIVERPEKWSEIQDILYKLDIFDMVLQIRGGLDPETIYGIYQDKNRNKARKIAEKLLQERDLEVR